VLLCASETHRLSRVDAACSRCVDGACPALPCIVTAAVHVVTDDDGCLSKRVDAALPCDRSAMTTDVRASVSMQPLSAVSVMNERCMPWECM
jgi:hypothetical protein